LKINPKGAIVVNQREEAALQDSESGLKSNNQIVTHLENSPNPEITKRFLQLFGKMDDPFTFQLFPEKKDSKQFPKVLHGTFQDLYSRLAEENLRGSGVFITINQTDGKGRRKENITSVRAVFVDLDGAPLQPIYHASYPPHLVVESSPGRFHAYWSIHDCPIEEFSNIQKLLAEKFSGDPQVHDLSRCMRLPGFYHLKNSPFLTTVIDDAIASPIAFSAFKMAFGARKTSLNPPMQNLPANNVLQALYEYKMVLLNHSSPQGCWTIKCPWEQLHSKVDHGTKYYEPCTNGYPNHGFKCFHQHCENRTIKDLLDFLGINNNSKAELPLPLFRALPPPSQFPISALGGLLEGVVIALNRVIKAPTSLCAQSVLGCAGFVVQPHFNIHIDGRVHPLSLYMISVGESGERKTGIDNVVLATVRDYEKAMIQDFTNEKEKHKNAYDLYERNRKNMLNSNKTTLDNLNVICAPELPIDPIMIIQEPTFPALVVHLSTSIPSIGLFSAEGGQLFGGHAMKDENIIQSATGLSLLWDKGEINRARVKDGVYNLYGKRVSLNLMIQPIIAEKFFSNEILVGQGFFSRCLICWPESTIGTRMYQRENIFNDSAIKHFKQQIAEILDQSLPLKQGTKNELCPRKLSLDGAGYQTWISFHDEVEQNMLPQGEYSSIKAFGAKAAENALRIAGILFGFEHQPKLKDSNEAVIPCFYMENAIAIMRFYLSETLRIQGTCQIDQNLLEAKKLLDWIREKKLKKFPTHLIYQSGPNSIREVARAKTLLNILAKNKWISGPIEGEWEGKYCKEIWTLEN
jgi:hypothetical protein